MPAVNVLLVEPKPSPSTLVSTVLKLMVPVSVMMLRSAPLKYKPPVTVKLAAPVPVSVPPKLVAPLVCNLSELAKV